MGQLRLLHWIAGFILIMKVRITSIAILVFALVQNCATSVKHLDRTTLNKYDFLDSLVYQPRKKILIGIFSSDQETHSVTIDVLQRSDAGLTIIQTIDSLDSQFGETTPVFEDLNEDGLRDIKLQQGSGARGANVLFHVFLQDTTGQLKYIKGSNVIPNIEFDSVRHMITGTYFYAGTSFVDFKLNKDSLLEISGTTVSLDSVWTIREHYKLVETGDKVIISKDSVEDWGEGLYNRYR